ncbi:hypothetical protein SynBIOSE41_02775 [Synechococcus sp. BIOS-E4-1]|nr:hypothetical protein SynBIOSE41_02775 [Synechococcus sp. BIOS-E4-1]
MVHDGVNACRGDQTWREFGLSEQAFIESPREHQRLSSLHGLHQLMEQHCLWASGVLPQPTPAKCCDQR